MQARPAAIVLAALATLSARPAAGQQRPAAPPATRPGVATEADVPVREVVLYSSGVGYFEHFGTVHGDGTAELRFKASQINDILKSLVLQDLDGGQVRAVTYPSQDPIAKTLKSFQVDITANPPLADLLNQLRGARITISRDGSRDTGTILGVERRRVVVKGDHGDDQTAWQPVLNLVSDGQIASVPMGSVTVFKLDDPQLQAELTRALAALAGARDQDKKPVRISFGGTGERRVRLGYVVETPVWKTSYRLVLPPRVDAGAGGPATRPAQGQLQGWAIVENQTDNDWTDVQMKLVSGRPISFVEDLYQPLYVPRPVVVPDRFASLRPQAYAGATGGTADAPAAPPASAMPAVRAASTPDGGRSQSLFSNSNQDQDAAKANGPIDPTAGVRSLASAGNVGELFEYTVGSVSLPRQRSAMIPIITDPVEVERVSIYNGSVLPRNPLNGARVKNTTGKLLLAGPVTVLDGAGYAGDAQVDNVPAGQDRLLSYGVDLQMTVDGGDPQGADHVVSARFEKGVLYVSKRSEVTQTYVATNRSDHEKVLVVEHPRTDATWHLVDSPAPWEQTDAVYRFREAVPAGRTVALRVQQQQTAEQTVQVVGGDDDDALLAYTRTGEIAKPVRDALAHAVELKAAMVDTQRRIDQQKQKLTDVTAEQGRIRENLKSVQPNTPYYTRLTSKLDAEETDIEAAQGEANRLQGQIDGQRKDLEAYLAGLTVG